MNIKPIPIQGAPDVEAWEERLGPADLALMAGAVCAALAIFWWVWKRLVK